MPKIESEKIDCLYRPCSRPAPRGKIESVRTHSEVIEQFDSFSMLKLLFLVRNWHCWSRKAFPRQMTPQSREKTAKTAVFRHRWQAWKVVRSIAAVRQRPRTPRNWRCSFAFFETFLWHFNRKQHAEVIFRLSRPVSCKNHENGSRKRWSLQAPLNLPVTSLKRNEAKELEPEENDGRGMSGVHFSSVGRAKSDGKSNLAIVHARGLKLTYMESSGD